MIFRYGIAALGLLWATTGDVLAQAPATQVSCGYAVTASNSSATPMGARYTTRFALFPNGTVQQYNSRTQRWVQWSVQTFTPQRVAMTSPSSTPGCNLAVQMDRSNGTYRQSLRCANQTAVDYVGSCERAAAAPAPAQRF